MVAMIKGKIHFGGAFFRFRGVMGITGLTLGSFFLELACLGPVAFD